MEQQANPATAQGTLEEVIALGLIDQVFLIDDGRKARRFVL
jgi:hypothetical protein